MKQEEHFWFGDYERMRNKDSRLEDAFMERCCHRNRSRRLVFVNWIMDYEALDKPQFGKGGKNQGHVFIRIFI